MKQVAVSSNPPHSPLGPSPKHLLLLFPLYQPRGHCNSPNSQINVTKANASIEPCTTREKDDSAKEAGLQSQEKKEEKQDQPAAMLSILLYRPHSEDIRFVELGKERDS